MSSLNARVQEMPGTGVSDSFESYPLTQPVCKQILWEHLLLN